MKWHMRVEWHHQISEDPTLLFYEVVDGEALRKIEVWSDGHYGFADQERECGGVYRAQGLIPTVGEISAMGEFTAVEITQDEFERLWQKYVVEGPGCLPPREF